MASVCDWTVPSVGIIYDSGIAENVLFVCARTGDYAYSISHAAGQTYGDGFAILMRYSDSLAG